MIVLVRALRPCTHVHTLHAMPASCAVPPTSPPLMRLCASLTVALTVDTQILDKPECDREEWCKEQGAPSVLSKIITTGFKAIHLIYFFTAGADEVKCWQIRKGTKAPQVREGGWGPGTDTQSQRVVHACGRALPIQQQAQCSTLTVGMIRRHFSPLGCCATAAPCVQYVCLPLYVSPRCCHPAGCWHHSHRL